MKLKPKEISRLPDIVAEKRRIWDSYEDGTLILTNDFIVCPKCRCYYCDIIRSVASHY